DFHFTYKFVSAKRGQTTEGGTATPVLVGASVAYDRGAVLERYTPCAQAIEQEFVFASIPPGEADLVILGSVDTNLLPDSIDPGPTGLVFRAGRGVLRTTYGHALAFDASGRSVSARLQLIGNLVAITVPATWLEHAQAPITIDPLIGSNFQVASDG